MKAILFFFLIILIGHSSSEPIWLVTTRDPHLLEDILKISNIKKSEGRHLVVTLKTPPESLPDHLKKYFVPVSWSMIKSYTYQSKKKIEPNPAIVKLFENLSKDRYQDNLKKLVSFENRKTKGLDIKVNSGNELATNWIKQEFEKMDLKVSLQCYRQRTKAKECNVIAMKEGTDLKDEKVIISAHLDDVGHLHAGLDDNASGVAALIEIAHALVKIPLKRTVLFVAFNGEEVNLDGSTYFVDKLSNEEAKKIHFFINMDMVAYSGTGTIQLESCRLVTPEYCIARGLTSEKCQKLAEEKCIETEKHLKNYAEIINTYTTLKSHIVMPAWGSDHQPFLERDIAGLLTMEDWGKDPLSPTPLNPCYHKACDSLDQENYKLDLDFALGIIQANVAAIIMKAQVL